jgi:WD40 repeat protein
LSDVFIPGGYRPAPWPSPDLARIATETREEFLVFDTRTGQRLLRRERPFWGLSGGASHAHRVAFTRDGRFLAAGLSEWFFVWSLPDARQLFPEVREAPHISWLELSADERSALLACQEGKLTETQVRRRELATGRDLMPPIHHADGVHCATFSPDERTILTTGEDGAARLWDAATGQPLTPPLRHADRNIYHGAFSPDGRRLATIGPDGIRVWDTETGWPIAALLSAPRPPRPYRYEGEVHFLGDANTLLALTPSYTNLWHLPSDPRPASDIRLHAQLLAGHRLDATGALEPLPFLILSNAWHVLREKYPERFATAAEH